MPKIGRSAILTLMNNKNVTAGILALTISISSVPCGTAKAGLYQTSDQLEAKYGEPVEVQESYPYSKQFYKSGDYLIEAWIARGRVVRQITKRVDGKNMTTPELNTLLGPTTEYGWKYQGSDTWKKGDGMIARYNSFAKNLVENLNR